MSTVLEPVPALRDPNVVASLGSTKHSRGTSIWEIVSRWHFAQDPSQAYWWTHTGPYLALMLKEANYPTEKQFEYMLFYYHWIIPQLGLGPRPDGSFKWSSNLTADGTPLQFCWNWNNRETKPEIRTSFVPIGPCTGTPGDPLNHNAAIDLHRRFASINPATDLAWFEYFLSAIYEQDNEKIARETEERFGGVFGESVLACFEFKNKTPVMKTYLWPRLLGYHMMTPYPVIEPAVRALLGPSTAALDLLDEFLHTNPVGKAMAPTMIAIDNKPSSRLKWYFHSPSTTFASVRQVMTLGGRIQGIDHELESLCDLIKATFPLPSDFPDDAEVTKAWQTPAYAKKNFDDRTEFLSGYLYYFDIAPGSQVPGIKFYAQTRLLGTDDLTLAKGITSWMKAHGRGKYCDNYMRVLEGLAEGPLEQSKGLHAHISFMSKDGEIDVSSYLSTGLFNRTKHAAGNAAN
ncbi:hypothetical protein N7491_000945 [Penicillium cf. griseofulvum]|uniref:Dimethylallyl tryptophan synthase GliD1 n=1 Tax=Penicillium cf. griseofulvum TaxID=2972120 RepID=A0A9W9M9E0_9EURO|nr:hypothetical protein N7472_006080 [Penicillium cf. griseofulvum]KAJ5444863.1 hypothetical protein N7491_000945 [Penicillium cf. griseofulvum]KAJ5446578.1 hypothetical protein N7445_001399 [Penicillium cf. griseofulvum]